MPDCFPKRGTERYAANGMRANEQRLCPTARRKPRSINIATTQEEPARCRGAPYPKIFSMIRKTSGGYFRTNWQEDNTGLPTLAITGGTAGLIVADPHIMPYFRTHAGNLDDINDVFDPLITTAEVVAVPAGLMIAGYARHDQYQVGTALLAAEAYADSAVVDLAMKAITRRQRPSDVPPGQPFTDTFFAGGKSPFKGSSFPSGHAAGVFSVATVVASRYHNHRWVPWLAYSFATAISLSRVTTSAHFPSDVFLGAALGYTITRFQVLRPR